MMTGFGRLMRDEHPTQAESLPDKLLRYWDNGREEGRRELAERIGAVLRNHENSRKALEQINDICYPWLK